MSIGDDCAAEFERIYGKSITLKQVLILFGWAKSEIEAESLIKSTKIQILQIQGKTIIALDSPTS